MEKPILDPSVPYIGQVFGGSFTPGRMVRIQGTIPSVAYRFDINLQCGPETHPRDDIAIQVSVHLLDGYICLNSLQNNTWGEEQRHLTVPVKRAERFEIIVLCDYNQYKVAINGQHYCEFPQRLPYDRISHLSIDGDISIIQITYESSFAGNSDTKVGGGDFEMIEYVSQPPPYNPYQAGSYTGTAPYPTGISGLISQSPPGVPPHIAVPIPLNAHSSNFRTVTKKHPTLRKCCKYCLGLIFGFVIAFIIVLCKKMIRKYI